MKKYQLQKIDVASTAKIYLAFGVIIGLVFGGLGLIFLIAQSPANLAGALVGGFFMIIFYALVGSGMTALMVWVYNMIADRIGGVIIYVNEEQNLAPGPGPQEPRLSHDDPTLI